MAEVLKNRNDWLKTSTGVGHHYRPGYYFPDSDFETLVRDPLPPVLAKQREIIPDERFITTTGTTHDRKYVGGVLAQTPAHQKAPGHWKVNYVKEFAEQLGKGSYRKPLTMGNQESEFQEKYKKPEKMTGPLDMKFADPRPFNLKDHHAEGPSKNVIPTTENPKLKSRPFYPRDRGVLSNNDMYMTTNQKTHRPFTNYELENYPRKDNATYWECEEYPKAWGHGSRQNPLPKDTVPREPLPMRDTLIFKQPTKVRRYPKSSIPVPHSGLKSLQQDSYTRPNDVKVKEANYCPVDTPYVLPRPGAKSAFAAPGMYTTEYQNVGSEKTITLTGKCF